MTTRMANRAWHRDLLGGHLGWGFTGWGDARLVAVNLTRSAARIEVFGHYAGLHR